MFPGPGPLNKWNLKASLVHLQLSRGQAPKIFRLLYINRVLPKIGKNPKMDGENNGRPY